MASPPNSHLRHQSGLYADRLGSMKGQGNGYWGHLLSLPVKSTLNSLVSPKIIHIIISHKGIHLLFPLLCLKHFAGVCLKC